MAGLSRMDVGLALLLQLAGGLAWAAAPGDGDGELIVTGANNIGWLQAPAEPQALAPDAAQAAVMAAATGSAATAQQAPETGAQPRVLTPIQGPLNLEGRYLGDLSGEVALDGWGRVDAVRLVDLLKPVASPQLLQALRDRIGGRERIAFEELNGDGFALAFDTLSLSFEATLGAEGRARQRIDFGQAQAVNPGAFDPPADFSAMANVSFGQTYDHNGQGFRGVRGASDILVNWGGFDGVTLSGGFDYDEDADDRFRRHEIRLTKDLFQSAVRLTAGEFSPSVTGFQGSDRILGVSAGRAYSVIRPFQNIRPSGRREFVLDRRSFVEVEVNGVIVERLQLDPGPYSLSDFPFAQGANTVRLLVDDGIGRREIAVFDLYGGAGLLDRGIVDFGVSAGVLQEGGEFEYGDTPAFSAYYRRGLTDALSAGGYAQWVDQRGLVGGTATWGSSLGLVDVGLAASHNGATGDQGYAASLDYVNEISLLERDDTRLIVSGQAFSRDFQNAFERLARNPEVWRLAAQVSSRLRRYTVTLGAAMVKGRDSQPDEKSFDLSIGRSFGRFGLTLSLGHRRMEFRDDETRVGLSLTLGLGRRWSMQTRYDSAEDFREVLIRRASNGALNDVSGGLRVSRDDGRETIGGDLRYINNRFDAELVSNRLASLVNGGQTTQESSWRVSTLLAYADRRFGIGRPGREGFVMARRHDSLRRSALSLTDGSGRPIARAGAFGPAVAPIDRAYGAQRFEITVDPLPAGYDLGSGVISAFPGYGNGYAVTVGSDASRTAVGVLLMADGSPAALISGIIVRADSADQTTGKPFFTNRSGRFLGDGLAPGRYRLISDGKQIGTFEIPQNREGMIDVGRIQLP